MKLKVIPAMGKPAKAGDMSAVILKVFYFQKKKKKISEGNQKFKWQNIFLTGDFVNIRKPKLREL